MRIDAHQHFWTLSHGYYPWLTPDLAPLYRDFGPADLAPLLSAHDITGTILVQAAECAPETHWMLDQAARHDWILGVVGWCDLAAPDAADRIAELAQQPGLVGLRPMLQDMDDAAWILNADKAPALAAMEAAGLVFDALIRPRHLPHIAELADRYPAMTIVIDHAAKPPIGDRQAFDAWQGAMYDLSRRPNVACKLSGLVTEAARQAAADLFQPYIDLLRHAFGDDRLIWGSDWPVVNLRMEYADWVGLSDALLRDCAPDARAAIYGGNAVRLYRLDHPTNTTQT